METNIRLFKASDLPAMKIIWNDIVDEGCAFPETCDLCDKSSEEFFGEQSAAAVAILGNEIQGLYVLHPNGIGRCAHIANASYAVKTKHRGKNIGEKLVRHSMEEAKRQGFHILQFNAVAASNTKALKLYEKLGFTQLGTIPGGFRSAKNGFEDIIPHYITL